MTAALTNVVFDIDAQGLPEPAAVRPTDPAGAPRVTAPVVGVPPSVPPASIIEAIVVDFPGPAMVFDRHGVCTQINPQAAMALRLNRRLAVGSALTSLRLPPAFEVALRYVLGRDSGPLVVEREVVCEYGNGGRRFVGTLRPDSGDVLVTWADEDPQTISLEIVEA